LFPDAPPDDYGLVDYDEEYERILAEIQENEKFKILSAHYMRLPFINLWVSHLLRNQSLTEISLSARYDNILSTRGKALIALSRHDSTGL